MGRNTYPHRGPRTSLIANRETLRAMRGTAPAAFGIYRVMESDSNDAVTDATFNAHVLEGGDTIPVKVELRDRLSITLLSQKVIGRQLSRGRMAGFNLGQARALLERDPGCVGRREGLKVDIGDIKIFAGRVVYANVLSAELEEEAAAIHDIMETIGFRGVSRLDMRMPHLTLGETVQGQVLSKYEQDRIIEGLHPAMPVSALAEPWDTRPYDVFGTAVAA